MASEGNATVGPDSTAEFNRVFGASVIGPLHVQMDLPCQDACAYRVLPSGAILVAVADGLGSASLSETGAALAVTAAIRELETMLEQGPEADREAMVRGAARAARNLLEEHQKASGCQLKDLACTLILALLQDHRLTVGHIGDGAVVAELEEGFKTVSEPWESEFANEVVPLTSATWERELRTAAADGGVQGIAVFTDGCQRAAFKKSETGLIPFEGFFRPVFSFTRDVADAETAREEIKALLASEKICSNSDDDKTLVIAVVHNHARHA